ncbi:MAG: FMN-binding protein [Firmicutes bacterium]|nr:FMN-binding protein [Bacillota bacterium]
MNSNTFKEYIQPVVVLVAICLVITFALAFVNGITAPIIADNAAKAADAARTELLPSATSFEQYTGDLVVYTPDAVYVTDCYTSNDGGAVVTVATKSFGGMLTEMIGIDATGAITGVKVMSHGDTKGLGTKAFDVAYLEGNYTGKTELGNAANIKADSSVSFISGATISSNGVYQGVCAALEQFKLVGGAN